MEETAGMSLGEDSGRFPAIGSHPSIAEGGGSEKKLAELERFPWEGDGRLRQEKGAGSGTSEGPGDGPGQIPSFLAETGIRRKEGTVCGWSHFFRKESDPPWTARAKRVGDPRRATGLQRERRGRPQRSHPDPSSVPASRKRRHDCAGNGIPKCPNPGESSLKPIEPPQTLPPKENPVPPNNLGGSQEYSAL